MRTGRDGAYQQAVGAVHRDAARERVVDGELADVRGRVVASLLVHVARQVEVDGVLPHQLLPHVPQLHALQVRGLKAQCKLQEGRRGSEGLERCPRAPHRGRVPSMPSVSLIPASAMQRI